MNCCLVLKVSVSYGGLRGHRADTRLESYASSNSDDVKGAIAEASSQLHQVL